MFCIFYNYATLDLQHNSEPLGISFPIAQKVISALFLFTYESEWQQIVLIKS